MSSNMFKTANFEDEIYRSMEKKLVANQDDENHGLSKIAKATDYLNAAAEIFEQAGMTGPAEEINNVMQDLAQQFTNKTLVFGTYQPPTSFDDPSLMGLMVFEQRLRMAPTEVLEKKKDQLIEKLNHHAMDLVLNPDIKNKVRAQELRHEIDNIEKELERRSKMSKKEAMEQLTSRAFSLEDLAGLDKGTLHDLLEHSAPAQLVGLAKKVMSVASGEKSATEAIKELLKERDLSDPKVRERLIKQIMV